MRAVRPLFGQQCTTKILPTSFAEYLLTSTSIVSPYTSTLPPQPPLQKHHSSTKHFKTHYHLPSITTYAITLPTSTLPTSTCAAHWTLLMPWAATHHTSTFVIHTQVKTIHQHPPVQILPSPHNPLCHRLNLPPAVRHYLPTLQPTTPALQHSSTQTTPPHSTTHASQQTELIITPPMINEDQQTTPRPDLCDIEVQTAHEPQHTTSSQTDIHAIVRYPGFATPNAAFGATSPADTTPHPTTPISTATITSANNKQPNPERPTDHWAHADLIPTPTVDQPPAPAQPSDFVAPVGGTPQRPRSKTPPRSGTPRRTRFSQERPTDPRHGSPAPHPRSTTTPPPVQPFQQQPQPFAQPKRPPPPLPDFTAPTAPIPYWSPVTSLQFQAPYPSTPPPSAAPPITQPWPAPYAAQQYHHTLPPPQPQPASTFLGDQAQPQPHSQYMLPPTQPPRPQRVQLGQEEYRTEDDPWCNYGRGWERQ